MNEIVPIFKPKGVTPTQIITRFKELFTLYAHQKISPAGRLDPMAEGLLVLLIGDSNKQRDNFLNLDKTYEFTMLFGIKTDTYDILGRINHSAFPLQQSKIEHNLQSILPTYLGKSKQLYPPYSSKTVNGKPLFYWARQNKLNEIAIPSKDIDIKELKLLSLETRDKNEIVHDVLTQIRIVRGDFRQKEIKKDWEKLKDTSPHNFIFASCRATVTSGTYIRSLCHRIGEEIGCGAIAYTIKRTHLGNFSLADALILP